MIRKIGLTGGIASGKSRVAEMLAARLDCVHIDVDKVCRRLLEPQAEGWQKLSKILDRAYFTGNGTIDRSLLRHDLFNDSKLRQKINRVIHPLARKEIITQMDLIINSDTSSKVLVEVPLLFEAGWEDLFDVVIVVHADHKTSLNRLMSRDGMEELTAVKEMESQLPLADKVMKADYVIENSGLLSDTDKQVVQLVHQLKNITRQDPLT